MLVVLSRSHDFDLIMKDALSLLEDALSFLEDAPSLLEDVFKHDNDVDEPSPVINPTICA
jgi:hypothetical protein